MTTEMNGKIGGAKMDYVTGLLLAIATCGAAYWAGFDRERVFYPTMLIVIATFYVLFALMGGSDTAQWLEITAAIAFAAAAIAGFGVILWIVVVGIVAHGVFDWTHSWFYQNAGMPAFWPGFCAVFDVVAAAFLAGLLWKRPGFARSRQSSDHPDSRRPCV